MYEAKLIFFFIVHVKSVDDGHKLLVSRQDPQHDKELITELDKENQSWLY